MMSPMQPFYEALPTEKSVAPPEEPPTDETGTGTGSNLFFSTQDDIIQEIHDSLYKLRFSHTTESRMNTLPSDFRNLLFCSSTGMTNSSSKYRMRNSSSSGMKT
ncbi:unnamed protein product [Amoebophrya sp. A25]|nr:unnamed protein product [Amoebophrya sp. A25]|eukprot:GSA25T00008291001.1